MRSRMRSMRGSSVVALDAPVGAVVVVAAVAVLLAVGLVVLASSTEVTSARVKPSWQATKLMEAAGRRPESLKKSEEPVRR